ncbi:hypothetical protein M137_2352 [Bacteroides fragilis str. S36L12]|nr:hypothetical protein M137_2352 [Bacteroides fragilis str. S36L12]
MRMRITLLRMRNAYIGSRLAFRGKIVRAQSVAAYKAIREVA